jgi:hypothetical protein
MTSMYSIQESEYNNQLRLDNPYEPYTYGATSTNFVFQNNANKHMSRHILRKRLFYQLLNKLWYLKNVFGGFCELVMDSTTALYSNMYALGCMTASNVLHFISASPHIVKDK